MYSSVAASGFISRQAGHDVRIGEVSRCIQEVMEAGEVPWLTKIADDWVLNCRFYSFFFGMCEGIEMGFWKCMFCDCLILD